MDFESTVPVWVLGLGGVGIVFGLATWGWRVMATIGKKITELTPTRGFAAEFAAATTIVLASKLGLPISTTHTACRRCYRCRAGPRHWGFKFTSGGHYYYILDYYNSYRSHRCNIFLLYL